MTDNDSLTRYQVIFTSAMCDSHCRAMPLALWLAEAFGADIKGILVEEIDSESCPELPWSVEVLIATGKSRPFKRETLARDVNHHLQRLSEQLSTEAAARNLHWQYELQRAEQLTAQLSQQVMEPGFLVFSPTGAVKGGRAFRIHGSLLPKRHIGVVLDTTPNSAHLLEWILRLAAHHYFEVSLLLIDRQEPYGTEDVESEPSELPESLLQSLSVTLGPRLHMYRLNRDYYQRQIQHLSQQIQFECVIMAQHLVSVRNPEEIKDFTDRLQCPLVIGLTGN